MDWTWFSVVKNCPGSNKKWYLRLSKGGCRENYLVQSLTWQPPLKYAITTKQDQVFRLPHNYQTWPFSLQKMTSNRATSKSMKKAFAYTSSMAVVLWLKKKNSCSNIQQFFLHLLIQFHCSGHFTGNMHVFKVITTTQNQNLFLVICCRLVITSFTSMMQISNPLPATFLRRGLSVSMILGAKLSGGSVTCRVTYGKLYIGEGSDKE